jgi:hypothetical protein
MRICLAWYRNPSDMVRQRILNPGVIQRVLTAFRRGSSPGGQGLAFAGLPIVVQPRGNE